MAFSEWGSYGNLKNKMIEILAKDEETWGFQGRIGSY